MNNNKAGQKHGHWLKYQVNGNIQFDGNWVNGERHGQFKHYTEDGVMYSKIHWRNGLRHGKWQTFPIDRIYNNDYDGWYKDDVKIGLWAYHTTKEKYYHINT